MDEVDPTIQGLQDRTKDNSLIIEIFQTKDLQEEGVAMVIEVEGIHTKLITITITFNLKAIKIIMTSDKEVEINNISTEMPKEINKKLHIKIIEISVVLTTEIGSIVHLISKAKDSRTKVIQDKGMISDRITKEIEQNSKGTTSKDPHKEIMSRSKDKDNIKEMIILHVLV